MSDTQDLSRLLFNNPEDSTLRAALVEHLECDRSVPRAEAERRVEKIARAGAYRKKFDRASALCNGDDPRWPHLAAEVVAWCGDINYALPGHVALVPGWGRPAAEQHGVPSDHTRYYLTTWTVGVEWILAFADASAVLSRLCDQPRAGDVEVPLYHAATADLSFPT